MLVPTELINCWWSNVSLEHRKRKWKKLVLIPISPLTKLFLLGSQLSPKNESCLFLGSELSTNKWRLFLFGYWAFLIYLTPILTKDMENVKTYFWQFSLKLLNDLITLRIQNNKIFNNVKPFTMKINQSNLVVWLTEVVTNILVVYFDQLSGAARTWKLVETF